MTNSTISDSRVSARPRRRPMPTVVASRIDDDRAAARAALARGDTDLAWDLLATTHILSQPWWWPHTRSHLDMLRLAVRTRDLREFRGQLLRLAVAGPASAIGKYPLGNTGRSNVPATLPMPLPPELAPLLAEEGPPSR